jgi:hypothetical protein
MELSISMSKSGQQQPAADSGRSIRESICSPESGWKSVCDTLFPQTAAEDVSGVVMVSLPYLPKFRFLDITAFKRNRMPLTVDSSPVNGQLNK